MTSSSKHKGVSPVEEDLMQRVACFWRGVTVGMFRGRQGAATGSEASALTSVLVVVLGGLLGGVLGGCETNPTTGRSQFVALSREEEVAIGQKGKPEMVREYGGEVARADLRQYVTEVGMRLLATTAQDDPTLLEMPWEFTLLNSNVINAFALPGGKVFMSKGLAAKMTNEAQLAAVLGHEIGHVTARHVNDRYARQMGAQLGLGLASIFLGGGAGGGADLSQLGGQFVGLALLSYDREQELESDALGMRYMVRAGYNPLGTKQVMEILAREAGRGGQPEFLSTHPHPESRVQQAEAMLAGPYASTQNNPQFKLGEQEFRTRFLSKLAIAYPEESEDAGARALAIAHGCGEWRGGCCGCGR